MISLSRYYRTALLLPIVLPLAAFTLHDYSPVFVFISLSLVFSGLGYLFFYALAYFTLGQRTSDFQKRKFVRWAPVLFVPFQFFGCYLTQVSLELTDSTPEISNIGLSLSALPFWAFFDLAFGYSYIVVIEFVRVFVFRVEIEERPNIRVESDA